MKFFVKDFCETVQTGVVICSICLLVDNDILYCGMENQPSPAYFSILFSFHTLKLYCGIATQPSPAYSSLYLIFFLSIS